MTTTRVARPVWEFVRGQAAERGVSVSAYVADIMAVHAGRPDLVVELDRGEEGLPLAM